MPTEAEKQIAAQEGPWRAEVLSQLRSMAGFPDTIQATDEHYQIAAHVWLWRANFLAAMMEIAGDSNPTPVLEPNIGRWNAALLEALAEASSQTVPSYGSFDFQIAAQEWDWMAETLAALFDLAGGTPTVTNAILQASAYPGVWRSLVLSLAPLIGDPLSPYEITMRLQTHYGDYVPTGLYQDTACTIPALDEGDPVAAWKDERAGGITCLNASGPGQPFLTFIDGVPMVEFSGGQWLAGSKAWGIPSALSVMAYEPLSDNEYTVFEAGNIGDTWTRFSDGTSYMGVFRSPRVNAFFAAPSSGETTLSIYSDDSEYTAFLNGAQVATTSGSFENAETTVAIGIDSGLSIFKYFTGRILAIIVTPNGTARTVIEDYITELRTPPLLDFSRTDVDFSRTDIDFSMP